MFDTSALFVQRKPYPTGFHIVFDETVYEMFNLVTILFRGMISDLCFNRNQVILRKFGFKCFMREIIVSLTVSIVKWLHCIVGK